jgi:uncharacterized damage-inducible protein DinB
MANEPYVALLQTVKTFFDRTVSCFREEDSEFAPGEGMFTVAQQIAHAAQAVEWFMEGAFRPQGMSTEFEAMVADVRKVTSLEDALTWWNDAMQEAIDAVGNAAPESWNEAIRGPFMAGQPRHAIIGGISDHCAHHRGALAVYARLRGLEPPMPYGE